MPSFIYRITNTINSKFYIGKTTKTIEERFRRHYYSHRNQNTYLYKAMRKYGIDNFKIDIIEETEFPNEREMYWIDLLDPHYNMTRGGDGGDTSRSPNYKDGMMKRVPHRKPSYGMLGKKHPMKGKVLLKNCCPIMCEGVEYPSIRDAELAYPGTNVRRKLDNPKYPDFYRLKNKTSRKCSV